MGEETLSQSRKRKTATQEEIQPKRARNHGSSDDEDDMVNELIPGKIKRIFLKNFMCHDALEMKFNSKINFLVGVNGSGKSAILTALTVGLGAKARDTDRGASLKGFVKQGKNTATIEITITNRGEKSYEWETYGDTITVIRTIGAASSYRIKSHAGQTISTKREELDHITKALNIQVDNPISILNQDAARSFLLTKKPEDLYKFYMRATRLDIVTENYKVAQSASDHAKAELAVSKKYLKDSEKVIKELEQKLEALKSLDLCKEEYKDLQKEVLWADVIAEEKNLLQVDKKIDHQNKEIEKLENLEATKATKEQAINTQIEELKAEIAKLESEAAMSYEKSEEMKQKTANIRKAFEEQRIKTQKFHKVIKEKESDMETLTKEIADRERAESENDVRRQEARQHIEEYEHQLEEIEATLRTKRTELMHLEENKNRIRQDETGIKMESNQKRSELNRKKQDLLGMQKDAGDALSVYGSNIPRLVRRIEEEHRRGRFRKKPIGPLGAYIKIKDQSWIPAIETFLSATTLKTFCVDNYQDRAILNNLMNEIFVNEYSPNIVNSKFFDRVHDVTRNMTGSTTYRSLYEMMDISDITVANTLIDNHGIERVLLIPTSDEACGVMDDFKKVPRNCRRAITKNADTFFPDPHYRSYGGKTGRPRFLQISAAQRIQGLQDEIFQHESQLAEVQDKYSEIVKRRDRSHKEHHQVQNEVKNLMGKLSNVKTKIEENKEILESFNNNIVNEYKREVEAIKTLLEKRKEEEAKMMEEYRRLDKEYKTANLEYKECRDKATNLDNALSPYKEKINELKGELKRLDVSNKGAAHKLQEAKQLLQKLKGNHQQQQRVVTTKTEFALVCCPRIESTRTVGQIVARSKELSKFIEDVEKEHGNKEELQEELDAQQEKYNEVHVDACRLQILHDKHAKRMKLRRHFLNTMKADVAYKVNESFSNILSLRNYKGTVSVDHKNLKLELEMAPINDAKRQTNNAKCLSGGERSYSTIGFILALWHCTGLPFYFLDEFDVFMDKVNRRMIIDILINHAQNSPNSQFTFLTPLDASHVKANSSITIHRMAPPERQV